MGGHGRENAQSSIKVPFKSSYSLTFCTVHCKLPFRHKHPLKTLPLWKALQSPSAAIQFLFFLKCHLISSWPDCRDTYRESPYCDAWKSKGFCKQYKDQLDTYCPKTCGFCISKYNWYFSPEKLTLTHKQHFMSHTRPRCNRISEWLTVEFILLLNQDAKYEETTVPPQNTTAPTPSQSATPPSSDQEKARPVITVVKNVIQRQLLNARFANTGNTNSKRGLPLFNREGNSALWSVNADTRITLPQPQQYDDMGGKENAGGGGYFLWWPIRRGSVLPESFRYMKGWKFY